MRKICIFASFLLCAGLVNGQKIKQKSVDIETAAKIMGKHFISVGEAKNAWEDTTNLPKMKIALPRMLSIPYSQEDLKNNP